MSEWNYIIGAYALTWIGIVGYAIHVTKRLSAVAARLRDEGIGSSMEMER